MEPGFRVKPGMTDMGWILGQAQNDKDEAGMPVDNGLTEEVLR
jgi:hypothetical protein